MYRKNKFFIYILLPFIFISLNCSSPKVFKAFNGDFSKYENNKIITEYCSGCHTHKTILPNEHIKKVGPYYKKDKYKNAKNCRSCHYLEKSFLGDISEKTIFP